MSACTQLSGKAWPTTGSIARVAVLAAEREALAAERDEYRKLYL